MDTLSYSFVILIECLPAVQTSTSYQPVIISQLSLFSWDELVRYEDAVTKQTMK